MDHGSVSSAMDDELDLRPPEAAELSGKHLAEELERRSLKITGFADDDIRTLQRASVLRVCGERIGIGGGDCRNFGHTMPWGPEW
jgi:hypothetical protein